MDFSPLERFLSLSLLLSHKTEERLRFTKPLILSSKISHQTQGIKERLSRSPNVSLGSQSKSGENDPRECGRSLLSSQSSSVSSTVSKKYIVYVLHTSGYEK